MLELPRRCTIWGVVADPSSGCRPPLEPGSRLLAARVDGAVEEGKPVAGLGDSCDGDDRRPVVAAGWILRLPSDEKQTQIATTDLHARALSWRVSND